MQLRLERIHSTKDDTIGLLFIDNTFFCFTCEDEYRNVKVMNETRIPAGLYTIVITFSARFKKNMPEIVNVPGFVGIRIHPGNTEKDTSGCILPGLGCIIVHDGVSSLTFSTKAYDEIFHRISKAQDAGDRVTIDIIDKDKS